MKMNRHFAALLAVILSLSTVLFAFTGCGKKEDPSNEPDTMTEEEDSEVAEWEEHTYKVQKTRKAYDTVSYSDAMYCFQKDTFDEETRNAYVKDFRKFMKKVVALTGAEIPEGTKICINPDAYAYTEKGYAELNSNDLGTTHFYTQMMLAITGEDVNYGLAYGFAESVLKELSLASCKETETLTGEEVAAYLDKDGRYYLLDLVLPLLEEYYVEAEDAKCARSAAVGFAAYFLQKNDAKALWNAMTEYADAAVAEETVTAKNEWLKEIGAKSEYETLQLLPFIHSHMDTEQEKYPYVFNAYLTIWHLAAGDMKEFGYEDMILGYMDLNKEMSADFDDAIAIMRTFFEGEIKPVHVYTIFADASDYAESAAAVYINAAPQRIELYYDWDNSKYSLLHEYCHYLTIFCNMNDMTSVIYEGMAESISSIRCRNRMSQSFYYEYLKQAGQYQRYKEIGVIDADENVHLDYMTYVGAAADFRGVNADREYLSVALGVYDHHPGPDEINMACLSYDEAASMTEYFFETYGFEETLKNCPDYDTFIAFLGADFTTIYKTWGEWNENKLKELGINY